MTDRVCRHCPRVTGCRRAWPCRSPSTDVGLGWWAPRFCVFCSRAAGEGGEAVLLSLRRGPHGLPPLPVDVPCVWRGVSVLRLALSFFFFYHSLFYAAAGHSRVGRARSWYRVWRAFAAAPVGVVRGGDEMALPPSPSMFSAGHVETG